MITYNNGGGWMRCHTLELLWNAAKDDLEISNYLIWLLWENKLNEFAKFISNDRKIAINKRDEVLRLIIQELLLEKCYYLIAQIAENHRDLFSNDQILLFGKMAQRDNRCDSALKLFWMAQDLEKFKRHLPSTLSGNFDSMIHYQYFWAEDLHSKYFGAFHHWHKKQYGVDEGHGFEMLNGFVSASKLAPRYDVIVGVTNGGLFSAFNFKLAGVKVVMCEAHNHKSENTFKWLDEPGDLRGKRVLLVDKDMVTGGTIALVAAEVKKFKPRCIHAFFTHNPPYTHPEKLPVTVTKMFYTGSVIKKRDIWKGYLRLKQIIEEGIDE